MLVKYSTLERCCFCFPLRYGLIVWGYIRLIMSGLILVSFVCWSYGFFVLALVFNALLGMTFWEVVPLMFFFLLLLVADIFLNVFLVVGGETKNVKYLELYFICGCILCVLFTIFGSILTYIIWDGNKHNPEAQPVTQVLEGVILLTVQFVIQVYVLLLVRSEVVKLKSNCHSLLDNHATDSEHTIMKYNGELENVPESNQCEKLTFEKTIAV